MTILNSTSEDIPRIFALYDDAIAYQKTVFHKQWEGFEQSLIENEVAENRQWKIVIGGEIACIFAITFDDEILWGEKSIHPAIYIHRIVTNPNFRGAAFVNHIIAWGREYCKANDKIFIRLDTWGDNQKLIDYYVKCGFNYLETIDLAKTDGLPAHYKGRLALLEIPV
jgi:hypothetical protein